MPFIDIKYTINWWKDVLGFTKNTIPQQEAPKPVIESPAVPKDPVKPTQPVPVALIEFNPGDFISSKEFTDSSALSEDKIQEFLKSKSSFLTTYKINDHLISYWIYKHCQDNGLNPKVVIAHAQKEQGLITQTSIPTKQRRLDYALGVGATDGGDNPKWKGMDQQFLGATLTSVKWFNRGEKDNKYPMIFQASDNPHLQISNSAVFSLYKFTPWVGNQDKQIGKVLYKAPFGNYLFYKVYHKFFG